MRFYTEPPYSDIEFVQDHWKLLYEKNKWKIMWYLRHLEAEIEAEKGILLLWDDNGIPRLQTKDFSDELTEKIAEALEGSGL